MIAKVFARKTRATPEDGYFDVPDLLTPIGITEVHISVTFTYDLDRAYRLGDEWCKVAPVKIGGPGTGVKGLDFTPGMYLKFGYVITSRGCPPENNCWFCLVPEREGAVRELPITEGWNVLDDNLLACSRQHIESVFKMLIISKHKYHKPIMFTGGFDSKRFMYWHIDWLDRVKPKRMYFAYDTPDDLEPLYHAGAMLLGTRIPKSALCCYVLGGYPGDTFSEAEKRLKRVVTAGFTPYFMLYRDEKGNYNKAWSGFQKQWLRPAIMRAKGVI